MVHAGDAKELVGGKAIDRFIRIKHLIHSALAKRIMNHRSDESIKPKKHDFSVLLSLYSLYLLNYIKYYYDLHNILLLTFIDIYAISKIPYKHIIFLINGLSGGHDFRLSHSDYIFMKHICNCNICLNEFDPTTEKYQNERKITDN